MKQPLRIVKFFLIVLVLALAGCSYHQVAVEEDAAEPNKAELTLLIEQATGMPEQEYTTASYKALQEAVASSAAVRDSEYATREQVDQAIEELRRRLDSLTVATNGIYRIECKLSLQSNNAVGNEWDVSFACNGRAIYSGEEITVPLGTAIPVSGTLLEQDKIPDVGTGEVLLTAENGYEETVHILVKEKGGRYAGHTAEWEWICTASLVGRA